MTPRPERTEYPTQGCCAKLAQGLVSILGHHQQSSADELRQGGLRVVFREVTNPGACPCFFLSGDLAQFGSSESSRQGGEASPCLHELQLAHVADQNQLTTAFGDDRADEMLQLFRAHHAGLIENEHGPGRDSQAAAVELCRQALDRSARYPCLLFESLRRFSGQGRTEHDQALTLPGVARRRQQKRLAGPGHAGNDTVRSPGLGPAGRGQGAGHVRRLPAPV